MGKGKRSRARRASSAASPLPDEFPFAVDTETARRLGQDGLNDLVRNLWAKDCQTCGWPLGDDAPALVVEDMLAMVYAHLHHPRCRPAQWSRQPGLGMGGGDLVSYDVLTFLMQGQRRDKDGTATRDDRPVFFVNPSLEAVMLVRRDGRWIVNTTEPYRQLGFGTPFDDFVVDRPVEDVVARLDSSDVAIVFEDMPVRWECSGDVPWREAVRDLGGVTVAITSAAVPSSPRTVAEFIDLLRTGQVIMGWVPLEGVERPLPEQIELPEAVGTYLLHYGPGEASVGELLATAGPEVITREQAQRWAAELLAARLDGPDIPGRLMWEPGKDPATWRALDPLSVQWHDIRFTTDGWQLIQLFSQMRGTTFSDEREATTWGTRAAKNLGRVRVIGWQPAEGTGHPNYTTMIGAGRPR